MLMNKKQIIITAGLGLICFASFFTVGLFTRTAEVEIIEDGIPSDAVVVDNLTDDDNPSGIAGVEENTGGVDFQAKQANLNKSLSEKALNSLVFEMRSKLSEFTVKEKMLAEKEGRIQLAIDELQKNVLDMEELRVKLTTTVSSIKQQQQILSDRMLRIGEVEKTNTIKIASMYDKMKPQQAGEIMINLAESNQLEYVVKIVYYMTERTSANLISEIGKDRPELSAIISDKMRWIEEVK